MAQRKLVDPGGWYWLIAEPRAHYFENTGRISMCRTKVRTTGNNEAARASDPRLEKGRCRACLKVCAASAWPEATVDDAREA